MDHHTGRNCLPVFGITFGLEIGFRLRMAPTGICGTGLLEAAFFFKTPPYSILWFLRCRGLMCFTTHLVFSWSCLFFRFLSNNQLFIVLLPKKNWCVATLKSIFVIFCRPSGIGTFSINKQFLPGKCRKMRLLHSY